MATQWHARHISTNWGIALLGFLLLATIILIPVLGQNQDSRSHASGLPQYGVAGACSSLNNKTVKGAGTYRSTARCQYTTSPNKCAGGYVDNYCGGGATYKCCVIAPSCDKEKGGKCITVGGTQAKLAPGGKYLSGYCPGPSTVKCYIPPVSFVKNCENGACSPDKARIADANNDGTVNDYDVALVSLTLK